MTRSQHEIDFDSVGHLIKPLLASVNNQASDGTRLKLAGVQGSFSLAAESKTSQGDGWLADYTHKHLLVLRHCLCFPLLFLLCSERRKRRRQI